MRMRGLEQIRLLGRHPAKGVSRTCAGYGALVAVNTAVVANLQKERAVPETIAAFNTLRTADAELLINLVLVVRVFDERALDGAGRAKLIFSCGAECVWFRLEIPGAEIAVTAHGERVNAFHSGLFKHTLRGAVAASKAFLRINLPDP